MLGIKEWDGFGNLEMCGSINLGWKDVLTP